MDMKLHVVMVLYHIHHVINLPDLSLCMVQRSHIVCNIIMYAEVYTCAQLFTRPIHTFLMAYKLSLTYRVLGLVKQIISSNGLSSTVCQFLRAQMKSNSRLTLLGYSHSPSVTGLVLTVTRTGDWVSGLFLLTVTIRLLTTRDSCSATASTSTIYNMENVYNHGCTYHH